MKDYSIIIVGGGIAGLYTACKLQDNGITDILIIEKSDKLGGRIQTIKYKKTIYEAGAARFSKYHIELIKLLKELNLYGKKNRLDNKFTYIDRHSNILPNKFLPILKNIIRDSKKITKSELLSTTLEKICYKLYGDKTRKEFVNSYHYYSELFTLNSLEALQLLKTYSNEEELFYILNGGLSQIIDRLHKKFKSNGGNIILNTKLDTLEYVDDLFMVSCTKNDKIKIYESNNVILTIGKTELKKLTILKPISRYLNAVKEQSLLRIYAIYPKDTITNRVWFEDTGKVVTDLPIKFVIPIDYSSGLIMISYTDGKYAEYMSKKISNNTIETIIADNLSKLFPDKTIPKPSYLKYYYWTNGVAYWKPGLLDSSIIAEKMIQPIDIPLYICGENYSNIQVWIEGALVTSNKVIDKIITIHKGGKTKTKTKTKTKYYTLNEVKKHSAKNDAWIVIDEKVYNVTKWIPNHPGGDIIMHGVGTDASKMFKDYNHSTGARKRLQKFYIGDLLNT